MRNDTWHRPERLLALANLIVTTRGPPLPPMGSEPPVAGREDCCYDPAIGRLTGTSGHRLFVHLLDGLMVSSSRSAVAYRGLVSPT
jgi:hypothetical protein